MEMLLILFILIAILLSILASFALLLEVFNDYIKGYEVENKQLLIGIGLLIYVFIGGIVLINQL